MVWRLNKFVKREKERHKLAPEQGPKICNTMDLYRLQADELVWELEVRGCKVGQNVEENRRLLRRVLTMRLSRSAEDFDPSEKLGICRTKLNKLLPDIKDFAEDNADNELKRIRSQLLHVKNRIGLLPPSDNAEGHQVHLLRVVEVALVAVIDAHKIATDTQDTERNNDESGMTSSDPVPSLIDLREPQIEKYAA
ncbi:hypothetical protein WA026_023843 [Henosepilachna vigintioctopunctata]|uniref:Uncharacterized protein n=1 Tax=Henosepilachna vigintioctopunctata TaxID=420089 RepID=A0AAW1V3R6_9CUCU